MIGFITDTTTAKAILAGIEQTLVDHGQPPYWTTGAFPIYTGDHAGGMFIPASDEILNTPLRQGLTPLDFEETHALIDTLGGLDARIELDPKAITSPEEEQL